MLCLMVANDGGVTPRPVPNLAAVAEHADDDEALLTAYARLQAIRTGQTKAGRPFWDLRLSDRSATVSGKIWDDKPRARDAIVHLREGDAVKLLFRRGHYQGQVQLQVQNLRRVEPEDPDFDPDVLDVPAARRVAGLRARTLVFDIETAPAVDLRRQPPLIAQAVAKHAERLDGDEGKVMSLSPFFGKVVSLALADAEREDDEELPVTVFVVPPEPPPFTDAAIAEGSVVMMSEPELLEAFWALAAAAELVVTYNGRGFDVPFLIGRSLVHGVPVRADLVGKPYDVRPHLDLYRVLTEGGRSSGPASLDVVCWALGLASPKDMMDGSMVATAYAKGELEAIARYNAGDVRATARVYRRVRDDLLRWRRDW
jgi:hypothetical protein